MSTEIKLTRAEQETHINFTAQERVDGVLNVYSDDPVWINKLQKLEGFEDVSDDYNIKLPGRMFQSTDGEYSISIRKKTILSDERKAELAERMRSIRKDG